MPDAGDWRIATLTITPADGTTAAELTVVAPDGTTTGPTAVTVDVADGVGTATAAGYELATAGEWVERWTVTGTGKSAERAVLLVAPDPAAAPSGARVYATTTDYAVWLGAAPPSGCRRALVRASKVVDEMLRTAVYDVDTAGLPANATVAAALRDAACAQAEYARATGDADTVGASSSGQVASFTIGGVSVTRNTATPDPRLPVYWSPTAWRILADVPVELLYRTVWGY